jgi:hypothetical protein
MQKINTHKVSILNNGYHVSDEMQHSSLRSPSLFYTRSSFGVARSILGNCVHSGISTVKYLRNSLSLQ